MTIRSFTALLASVIALALVAPLGLASADSPARTRVAQADKRTPDRAAERTQPAARSSANAARRTSRDSDPEPRLREIDFKEGSDVEGGTAGPDGDTVGGRRDVTHSSLLRIRSHFLRELIASAEDL